MAGVTVAYNGAQIAKLAPDETRVLGTAGKYCSDDITVTYLKQNPDDPVRFYDYDGTLVYSYTVEEFTQLTSMPPNPDHEDEGLIAQGWNWSLADAKEYATLYGILIIGQMYTTDDGRTRLYLNLRKGATSPYLYLLVDGTVDIDWGDGSAHDTMTGSSLSSLTKMQHIYPEAGGNFVLSFAVQSGTVYLPGAEYDAYPTRLLCGNSANHSDHKDAVYSSSIRKVEIGTGVTSLRNYVFNYCTSLESVTIPNTVSFILGAFQKCSPIKCVIFPKDVENDGRDVCEMAMINRSTCIETASIPKDTQIPSNQTSLFRGGYALKNVSLGTAGNYWGNANFQYCYSLKKMVYPMGATKVTNDAFHDCFALQHVDLPSSVTSIGNYAFYNCISLRNINLPDAVTSIGSYAFSGCYALDSLTIPVSVAAISSQAFGDTGLREMHFKPTTPPTVSNSNAFRNLPSECIIYVPYSEDHSILAAYQSATNYPSRTYLEE